MKCTHLKVQSCTDQWRYILRGGGGGVRPPKPSGVAGAMLCLRDLHGHMCQSASYIGTVRRPRDGYKDILCITQDREKSTDSVQGAASQESINSVEGEESTVSVERPTTHSVPLSSGCSGSTLSGTFSNDLRPPNPLQLCTPMVQIVQRSMTTVT